MTPSVGLVVRDVGTVGGIARYVDALAAGLAASPRARLEIAAVGGVRRAWPGRVRAVREPHLPLGGALAVLRFRGASWDVAHFPMQEVWPLFAVLPFPVVMTVHSVEPLFLERSEHELDALPYALLRLVRRRLATVVVPSPRTAAEVAEHLRLPAHRVRAIPHGVDHAVFRPDGPRAEERPYVLHVSHHQLQKNVVRLIEAFAASGLPDEVELVVGGDLRSCGAAYRGAVQQHGLAGRVRFLGPLGSDADLARLYRGALAFALPSLQESFGLPALEAMACGCSVLTSRGTGAADVVDDAGVLVDPRDVDSIAAGLAEVVARRDVLGARGVERAAAYTWSRSVEAHLDLYAELAG